MQRNVMCVFCLKLSEIVCIYCTIHRHHIMIDDNSSAKLINVV